MDNVLSSKRGATGLQARTRWNVRSNIRSIVLVCQVVLLGAAAQPLYLDDDPRPIRAEHVAADDSPLEDLVFFTEDFAGEPRWGCDGISMFGLEQGLIHLGKQQVSPSRMAATRDLGTVVAIRSNGPVDFDLSRRDPDAPDGRTDGGVALVAEGWRATFTGGIAITPDGAYLLAAAQQGGSWDSNCAAERYGVIQLRLANLDTVALSAGPVRHAFVAAAPVAEILVADSGRLAHFVVPKQRPFSASTKSYLHSVATESLTEVAPPIELPDLGGEHSKECGVAPSFTHAILSLDERFVLINSRVRPEIVVVDVLERRAWTVPVRSNPRITSVGGVAFNWASNNHGLLAIHGLTSIGVYSWQSGAAPTQLGSVPIVGIRADNTSGPVGAIAWSADGSSLIAAHGESDAEFASWGVTDEGRTLVRGKGFEVCANREHNHPNDVLTGNGILPTPTPVRTSVPTATGTPTPGATDTSVPPPASVTPIPTAIPTASPTSTAQPTHGPIYLPIGLHERCVPEIRRVDVVLVIDASTSMMAITASGGTKLDAAKHAARAFLDQLHFNRGDQVAIVTFNDDASLLMPLTGGRGGLDGAIDDIEPGPQTCLACGVGVAAAELASPRHIAGHLPTIVLLTDGRSNPGPPSEAVDRAAAAKADGVQVYTIGLGEDVDEAVLIAIATRPQDYFHAPRAEQLAEIYVAIAAAIPCSPAMFWGAR